MAHPIVFAGKTYTPLFVDEVRPMTLHERSELQRDIAESRKVNVPVVVTSENNLGDGVGIVDGLNRLAIAAELGLPADAVRFDVRNFTSLDEARELCRRLNVNRRHLSREEQEHVRQASRRKMKELRGQGLSTRQIAEDVGVDHKTVQSTLRSTGESSPVEHSPEQEQEDDVPKVQCKDGKTRPARQLSVEEREGRDEKIRTLHNQGVAIRDIADRVGVSTGTVVRVVNPPEQPKAPTARKRKETMRERLAAEADEAIKRRREEQRKLAETAASENEGLAADRERLIEALASLREVAMRYSDLSPVQGLIRSINGIADRNSISLGD